MADLDRKQFAAEILPSFILVVVTEGLTQLRADQRTGERDKLLLQYFLPLLALPTRNLCRGDCKIKTNQQQQFALHNDLR